MSRDYSIIDQVSTLGLARMARRQFMSLPSRLLGGAQWIGCKINFLIARLKAAFSPASLLSRKTTNTNVWLTPEVCSVLRNGLNSPVGELRLIRSLGGSWLVVVVQ